PVRTDSDRALSAPGHRRGEREVVALRPALGVRALEAPHGNAARAAGGDRVRLAVGRRGPGTLELGLRRGGAGAGAAAAPRAAGTGRRARPRRALLSSGNLPRSAGGPAVALRDPGADGAAAGLLRSHGLQFRRGPPPLGGQSLVRGRTTGPCR